MSGPWYLGKKKKKRRRPRRPRWPELTIAQILEWADAHHARTGEWPHQTSGPIAYTHDETWAKVDSGLRRGSRGLPGGSSLARLLAEARGVRNLFGLPPYSVEQILAWADAHHRRTGKWPSCESGPIVDAPGETWMAVQKALFDGQRGLPGGSSLARLLTEHRGKRYSPELPPLTLAQILSWADAYHQRSGLWPTAHSGAIPEAAGETWGGVARALNRGRRGLSGRSSLIAVLAKHRGVRRPKDVPKLSIEYILAWADAHHRRTGRWPRNREGPILDAPGETWAGVNDSLFHGQRGLPGGSSLARLLAAERGIRNRKALPHLTVEQILAWAVAHHERTGHWPTRHSGAVAEAAGETWSGVDTALNRGLRGLPRGLSLSRLREAKKRETDRPLPSRQKTAKPHKGTNLN